MTGGSAGSPIYRPPLVTHSGSGPKAASHPAGAATTPVVKARRLPGQRGKCCDDDIDAGYAWLIVVISMLGHVFTYGVSWSAGIFYDIFREEFSGSSGAISLTAALNTAFVYGAGPLSGVLTNRFGHRVVAMVGGVIAGVGLILSAYATSIYHLYLTFGVITGFGFGVANIAVVTIVPVYFEKFRSIAIGFAVCGAGVGTFLYPPLLRFLANEFGWRGAMLITGGITFNLCACGALMRQPRALERRRRRESMKAKTDKTDLSEADIYAGLDEKQRRQSIRKFKRQESLKKVNAFLHLQMFKSTKYLILGVNNLLFIFALSIVYVHLPAFAELRDISKDSAAMLISAIGIANLVGRILFGFLAKVPHLTSLRLYTAATLVTGAVILCFPAATSYSTLLAVAVAFGLTSAFIGTLLPQVISDFVTVELVPSGYGYILMFEAAGNLLGPPTAGWLYDLLNIYPASFYLSGVTMVISGLLMIITMVTYKKPPEVVLEMETTEPEDVAEDTLMPKISSRAGNSV